MKWPFRRRGIVISAFIILLVPLVGCDTTQSDDTAGTTTTTQTPVPVGCGTLLRELTNELQAYVDQFAGLTTENLLELSETPTRVDLDEAMTQFTSEAAAIGCTVGFIDFLLPNELERLTADGEIAQLVLTSIMEQMSGEEAPTDPAILPPETRRVPAGDDLEAAVSEVGAGSTILLGPGVHTLEEPLVILLPLALIGDDPDSTQIVSSAESAGIVFLGDGQLNVEGIEFAHTGEAGASLLVIRSGWATITNSRFRDAAGTDEIGGSAVVLASNAPDVSDNPTTITNSHFLGNASAGIVVTGFDSPTIRTNTFVDNGRCAICLFDQAAGSISSNQISEHDVGIIVAGTASPVLDENSISNNRSAGILYEEASAGTATGNTISDNGDVGVLISGSAWPTFERNDISGHEGSGIAVAGAARPTVRRNDFLGNGAAIEVGGESAARVEGNTIDGATRSGIVIGQSAKGLFIDNAFIGEMPTAIQIQDDARPILLNNAIDPDGLVGLLYMGSTGGRAMRNNIEGLPIGIQIGDDSAPSLEDNEITSAEQAAVVYNGSATGTVTGTVCKDGPLGIVLLDAADPDLGKNDCAVLDQRG